MATETPNTQPPPMGAAAAPAAPADGSTPPPAANVDAGTTSTAAGAPTAEAHPADNRGAEARELERQLDEARTKLREAEDRARENLDRWQRAQADLANFRRRAQFDREELEKYASAALVAALLPVLDSFDRAWQSLPGQFRRLTWLSGVAMINQQLRGTLERIGLTEIEADAHPFDPALHEAVDREDHQGQPHVVAVLQAGYKLHDRVLRPALVKVGPRPEGPETGPAAAPDAAAATAPAAPASPPEPEGEAPSGTASPSAPAPSP